MSKMNRTALAAVAVLLAGVTSAELPEKDGHTHMGVATCAASQCHGSAVPREGSNVLQNEYVSWAQDDAHSRAYDVLANEQSKSIAARLGLASATTAKICLDCHADNVPAQQRGERFHLSDGVGCESCHGGAENWLANHYNLPAVTHEASLAAGLFPTENVAARSELCLSCHLGTKDKFASHRIMAAGHPRLAFELDTFTELWRTAGRQPHYRIDKDYGERKGEVSHSYSWAAGLLAEGRQRLSLIRGPLFDGDGIFPELGFYDCHACHRSMKTVQWRPLPRHGGVGPGAPFLHDGTLVMSMALARALSPTDGDAIEAGLIAMHRAGADNVDAIRAAARELDGALASLQGKVTPRSLRGHEMTVLREILGTGAEGNYIDYISAEQAFMAVQMLVIEIDDPWLEDQLDRIADTLNNDERYRPAQFAAMLATLAEPETEPENESIE
ncbi:MAG: cytochrome c family protein [Woeseiaceae bacterium]|nr:cytochrome c family protein [Woeseiaceae bacterium]